jgi:hypothetical protein
MIAKYEHLYKIYFFELIKETLMCFTLLSSNFHRCMLVENRYDSTKKTATIYIKADRALLRSFKIFIFTLIIYTTVSAQLTSLIFQF